MWLQPVAGLKFDCVAVDVSAYLAQVDRTLAGGQRVLAGGQPRPTLESGAGAAPPPPSGSGVLRQGAESAASARGADVARIEGVDRKVIAAVGRAERVGVDGHRRVTGIRESARTSGVALGPAAKSPEGLRRLVQTMDQSMSGTQGTMSSVKRSNDAVGMTLRGLAGEYPRSGDTKLFGGGGRLRDRLDGDSPPLPELLGEELAPGLAPEDRLQRKTILLSRILSREFPELAEMHGFRNDPLRWHPNGLALDVMIPNYNTPEGVALGNRIRAFVMENRSQLGIDHVIWQQQLTYPNGEGYQMRDLGSDRSNHRDHVHIVTSGGGYPRKGERFDWFG